MKKVVFIILMVLSTSAFIMAVSADTGVMTPGQLEPPNLASPGVNGSGVNRYDTEYVDRALSGSSDEVEILKAILVCVRDIDIYVQYFVTIVLAVFLVWVSIVHPLLLFLR